jgi:hypothetical protein
MARDIPQDQPLTDADRQYLLDRGSWGTDLIKRIDENFPPEEPVALEDETGEDETGEPVDYTSWTKADLVSEVDRRNAEREDGPQLARSGTADDLRARLTEDDAEQAE